MKRIIALALCLVFVFLLTGCEAKKIDEAKELVDEIYECTMDMTEAEIELSDPSTPSYMRTSLEGIIRLNSQLIESYTDDLMDIYAELSAEGQAEIEAYISEAALRTLYGIW